MVAYDQRKPLFRAFERISLTHLLLVCAVSLSCVAAWYSIIGLIAIFASSPVPIAVMGSVLELSKLVLASWLYRNWTNTGRMLRSYFVAAIAVLMLLTSMGIFGFLSKAHLDQALPSGEVQAQVTMLDEKIDTQKRIIADNRTTLRQLDEAVNQTMSRSTSEDGAAKSVQVRRSQAKERAALTKEIEQAQAKVNALLEERAPIAGQLRSIEAEVGPVKYIASLVYGDNPDANVLEKAVRLVILMIVFVFDPLAVLMFIAVNSSLKGQENDRTEEACEEANTATSEEDNTSQETSGEASAEPVEASSEAVEDGTTGSQEEVLQAEGEEANGTPAAEGLPTDGEGSSRRRTGYRRFTRRKEEPASESVADPEVLVPVIVVQHLDDLKSGVRIGDKVSISKNGKTAI